MKKGKKTAITAIIIIAVIAVAAIVIGGLILGGVIPVGNARTASAQEIAVDDTAMNAYRTIPQVYKITLKTLYGMSADDVSKFYENNGEGWNVYAQTVSIKNRSDTAIVISNAKSEANGTGNIWVCSRTNEADYVTVAPGETGTFTFNVLAKGYSSPDDVKAALKNLNPSIVFAENKSAANQSFVKFDMTSAQKFAIDIKF